LKKSQFSEKKITRKISNSKDRIKVCLKTFLQFSRLVKFHFFSTVFFFAKFHLIKAFSARYIIKGLNTEQFMNSLHTRVKHFLMSFSLLMELLSCSLL